MEVYIYTFPNGKKYVGQTTLTVEERAKNGAGYRKNHQPLLYNAIQKYGWESISIEKFKCSSIEELNKLEEFFIKYYCTTDKKYGYNIKKGGDNFLHAKETKQKISEGLKKYYSTHLHYAELRNFQHTEETKQKISESVKKYWEQHPEKCLKHSGQFSTKNNPNSHRCKILETGQEFDKIKDLAEYLHCHRSTISKHIDKMDFPYQGYHIISI